MNKTILSGRIARDIKVAENRKTAITSIAVDRPYPFAKDKDGNKQADFITLKCIGEKNVDRVEKWFTKGTACLVEGILCRDSYKDKEGNFKENNYVIVNNIEFQAGKAMNDGQVDAPQQEEVGSSAPDMGFMNIPDNLEADLPFA